MRIAFCTWKFPALANTFILNEIVEVAKRGHDVRVVSIDRPDEAVAHPDLERYGLLERTRFLEDYLPAGATPEGPLARYAEDWLGPKVRALRPVARELRREGVQLVHGCFMNNSATVAMVVARLAGLPFTFECHAHDVFVDLRYAEEKVHQAQAVFSISEYNRRHLVEQLGCPPDKVVIRRVPILHEFCDRLEAGPREPGLVVTVGRLHPIKGFDDALAAFALVARENARARFLLIGDGELRDQLEGLARDLGVADRVEFTGSMANEEALGRVSRASAFLLPSVIAADGDRDGIPTSMIEAMYLRTPVVSTRVSGIPELVRDGENGLLAEPGDVPQIASLLGRLLADDALRERLGNAGRATIEDEFAVERNIDRLTRTWEAVVARWRGPGLLARLRGLLGG